MQNKNIHNEKASMIRELGVRGVGQFWCCDQDPVEILVGTKTVEENIWNEQP